MATRSNPNARWFAASSAAVLSPARKVPFVDRLSPQSKILIRSGSWSPLSAPLLTTARKAVQSGSVAAARLSPQPDTPFRAMQVALSHARSAVYRHRGASCRHCVNMLFAQPWLNAPPRLYTAAALCHKRREHQSSTIKRIYMHTHKYRLPRIFLTFALLAALAAPALAQTAIIDGQTYHKVPDGSYTLMLTPAPALDPTPPLDQASFISTVAGYFTSFNT